MFIRCLDNSSEAPMVCFRKPYFLCEVTATDDGVIRQKRLLNVATDLANRIGLSSRYVKPRSFT